MKKNEIIQITRLPRLILMLFFIQLIIFLFFYFKKNSQDLEIFYLLIPVTLLLVVSYLKIEFNTQGLKYKLFPLHFNMKILEWPSVTTIEIIKIDALSDFLGWGLRYSRKYGWGYILGNDYAIFITLKNGKKYTFTINDKDLILAFLEKNNILFQVK